MPGLTVTGDIYLDGHKKANPLWKDHVFVLLQEPAIAPDPTMSVGKQVAEIFRWRLDPGCLRQIWTSIRARCQEACSNGS
ncbi:hypothetical protein GCM10007385_00970 [Tateyamaria omphalii]|nr:hypothetical protein GCM10007385_00970 [Tateyamaria omphalii]